MERFLITGGMGFLGSHLSERLLREGKEVWALDLFEPPYARRLREHPRFHMVVDTIMNRGTLEKLVDRCDAVCHLAAIACPDQYVHQTRKTMDIGLRAGFEVIDLVRLTGKFLFFTSTSEIYGRNPDVPWHEDADRVLGSAEVDRWCYSTSKAALEHYIRACQLDEQLDYVTVRVFNAYGPRLRGRVLDKFVDDALEGRPLTVHGDGSQTRCFTYVDDLIEAFVRLIETPSAHNTVYNVGSSVETSILDLAHTISALAGRSPSFEFLKHADVMGESYEDIQRRVPDVSKIERAVGWKATTPLELGLGEMIAYRTEELGLAHA
ncbi:MAG TPA: NAD-dependent epimerase/dehydratase family protein [Planctomycetes bacterium]|nr:NAD-dependent epimerase/dehydratase family protein [Planctomycetota bacterium]